MSSRTVTTILHDVAINLNNQTQILASVVVSCQLVTLATWVQFPDGEIISFLLFFLHLSRLPANVPKSLLQLRYVCSTYETSTVTYNNAHVAPMHRQRYSYFHCFSWPSNGIGVIPTISTTVCLVLQDSTSMRPSSETRRHYQYCVHNLSLQFSDTTDRSVHEPRPDCPRFNLTSSKL